MSKPKSTARSHSVIVSKVRCLAVQRDTPKNEKPRCIATARSGKRCESAPVRGKKYCLFHTGTNASELGARGGRRRAIFNPDGLERLPMPRSADDVLKLLSHTLLEVRSAKIDTKTASAIFNGCGIFMDALQVADLEQRLKLLEEKQEKPVVN